MGAWQYMVTWESHTGANAPIEVLTKWRANLTALGADGYELVAEHYSESADQTSAVYRGTLKRPMS